MKKYPILISSTLAALLSCNAFAVSQSDAKAIEEMIEISPYRDIPQNKNIQNTLKNRQSPLKIEQQNKQETTQPQDSNKESGKKEIQNKQDEQVGKDGLVMRQDQDFRFKYEFSIDTKDGDKTITLEDLGINEKWLSESIVALKISDLNVSTLQEIANIVSYYFQYNGYPSATAYIPQQEITDTIHINIMIGKLGEYQVRNYSQARDWAITSKLRDSLKGKILRTRELEDVIYRINEMYGVQAKGTLTAGKEYGTTDVVIDVEDSTKASAMLFFDNYGTEGAGVYRMGVSGQLNNVLGFGDSLNLFAQLSDEIQKNYGATYTTFLGNLKISPRISRGNYELGGPYSSLNAYGTSLDIGVDLSYPVFINTVNSLYLIGGYTHRKLEDIYGDFGVNFNKHSNSGYIGVEGTFGEIPNNIFSYNLRLTYGDVVPDSELLTFSKAMDEFWKFNAYLSNSYYFNEKLTHIINVSYQQDIGGFELDSSETASLGGPYGVRAYTNGFGEVDNMVLATFGLRANVVNPNFYVTPFYEFAYGWNDNYPNNAIGVAGRGDKNDLFIDAAGLELLYMKPNMFYVKLDLAKAVTKLANDGRRRDRLYASVGVYF